MKFTLFTSGGTISSLPSSGGLRPGLTGEELLALCPDLMGFEHEVEIIGLMAKDSTDMAPGDWLSMAEQIRSRASGCDAAVLLHGTDTLAWTAAALSYLLNDAPFPLVLTGSMRPASEPGSDAPDNIFAAVQFAMQLAMYRRRGVAVAFAGDLIHGPRALKVDSRRPHAFISAGYPLLGEMRDKGTHKIAWLNAQTPKLSDQRPWGPRPEVERAVVLLPLFPGMRAETLDVLLGTSPRAVVLEGYGLGGLPEGELLGAVKRGVDAGIPFVMRTQALFGGTDLGTYEVGRRAEDLGVLPAPDMTREALMTKLMLLLPLNPSRDSLARLLAANLCDDVL